MALQRVDEEADLENILAMFDSNDLLMKLEQAVEVLLEIMPFLLPVPIVDGGEKSGKNLAMVFLENPDPSSALLPTVEQDELFMDAMSVLCGDLAQIIQLGLVDQSFDALFHIFDELLSTNEVPSFRPVPELSRLTTVSDHSGLVDEAGNVFSNASPSLPSSFRATVTRQNSVQKALPSETETDATSIAALKKKAELYKRLLRLLRTSSGHERFLSWFLQNEELCEMLYLPFAPLRIKADCDRILHALMSLTPFYGADARSKQESQTRHSGVLASESALPRVHPCSPASAGTGSLSSALTAALQTSTSVFDGDNTKVVTEVPARPTSKEVHLGKGSADSGLSGVVKSSKPKHASHMRSRSDGFDHRKRGSGSPIAVPLCDQNSVSHYRGPISGFPEAGHDPRCGITRSMAGSHTGSGYFSPPQPGQSLIAYLQSQDTETCADLERENAHFFISEVVIAAMEQMQYERRHKKRKEMQRVNTDGDMRRIGRFGSHSPPCFRQGGPGEYSRHLGSDGQSSGSATGTSGSLDEDYDPHRPGLPSASDTEEAVHILTPVHRFEEHPPSWNPSSTNEPTSASHFNSAEHIAVSLLRQFRETQLPKASELDWLVSENDVPQNSSSLLPLPKGTAVPPDTGQPHCSRIRGNLEWAPLRPQIIYHIQPHISLKVALVNQKGRCAGCGGRMDPSQQGRMRYCEYTGKYFCVCCHEYKTSLIPARILLKWDFTKYYVSNFAADFIARVYRDPLFDVSDCNPQLYKRSRSLLQTKTLRTQLVMANDYIKTCRQALSVVGEITQLPRVIFQEYHTYSLEMFCSVRDGILPTFLKPVTELAVQHVVNCKVCAARGFICEFCRSNTPVFPFQLTSTFQCPQCASCYHSSCIRSRPCPKCARLQARKALPVSPDAPVRTAVLSTPVLSDPGMAV